MNIEELKKRVIGNGFQESHGSTTMVIDVEAVIDLINEYQDINYTCCSTQLQTENKALTFDEWAKLNKYKFQRTTYFDDNGIIYFDRELKQMYKQYLSSL